MTKKIVLVLALMFAAYAVGESGRRFEMLTHELQDNDTSIVNTITAFHDRETGVEFICAESWPVNTLSGKSISCFPTGRNWK